MVQAARVDREELKRFVKQTGDTVAAGFNCAITVLGDRLELYKGLAELGSATPETLAEKCDLHPSLGKGMVAASGLRGPDWL